MKHTLAKAPYVAFLMTVPAMSGCGFFVRKVVDKANENSAKEVAQFKSEAEKHRVKGLDNYDPNKPITTLSPTASTPTFGTQ